MLASSHLLLRRCIETNLVLNFKKCYLMVEHGLVLGHVVFAKGLEVDKAKVKIIQSWPYPQTVREVKSFLRLVGFYYRFINDFSKIASPLCDLLAKDACFDLMNMYESVRGIENETNNHSSATPKLGPSL